jgi:hypothetical protein
VANEQEMQAMSVRMGDIAGVDPVTDNELGLVIEEDFGQPIPGRNAIYDSGGVTMYAVDSRQDRHEFLERMRQAIYGPANIFNAADLEMLDATQNSNEAFNPNQERDIFIFGSSSKNSAQARPNFKKQLEKLRNRKSINTKNSSRKAPRLHAKVLLDPPRMVLKRPFSDEEFVVPLKLPKRKTRVGIK